MTLEFQDWLEGMAIIGKHGTTYLPVATDENGQLYIVLVGAPDVTIPGTVNMNDLNTVKQIQGTDGSTFRTAKLDANGQFIIVPRGQSGNYMAVDASGFLTAVLKGTASGGGLVSIAVDASGQLIMVPRGSSGNYMSVDASGYLTAILKGLGGDAALHSIAVDNNGQLVMVPRGNTGNYMSVDASGYLTTVLKGIFGATLKTIQVDTNGNLVAIIKDPASGNVIAVDASGYLTSVLKGSYGGSLKTVAVDTDGRMIGVIPDLGGNFGNTDYVGLAELASRLGGLQRWDTRGRVLRAIGFDDGLFGQCYVFPSGAGGIVLDPERFEGGGYSAKIPLSGGAGEYGLIWFEVSPGTSIVMGIEMSFAFSASTFEVYVELIRYTGTTQQKAILKWDVQNKTLTYWGSGASYVSVPGATVPTAIATNFNHIKMVVNFNTGKYVRGIIGEYEVDMSTLSMQSSATAAANEIVAAVGVNYVTMSAVNVWVDNMILTHAEPT